MENEMKKCFKCGLKEKDMLGKLSTDNPLNAPLCFGCEQVELEREERKSSLPDPNDKEAMFRHEKRQQGWDDDMDEEIWNKHFRYE